MAKIVARFSNGFEDTYKGKREVKAAWALISKETGKVVASGHSMDMPKAQATAEINASGTSYWYVPTTRFLPSREYVQHMFQTARRGGLITPDQKPTFDQLLKLMKEDNARRRAAERAKYTIEVVAL